MRLVKTIAAVSVLLSALSCQKADNDDRPLLLVSIEPQRKVLESLAGSAFRVETMLPGTSNPETYEPSAAERMEVDKAEIYFSTGVLPFEKELEKSSSTEFVNTSRDIDFLYGTHAHNGHMHNVADPHYWSSVAGMRKVAANMAEALIHMYPDSIDVFKARMDLYNAHLDSLDKSLASTLAGVPARAFAVWHPSLSYFANDYGLKQITVGEDGKEMSARTMAARIDSARANNVRVLFFQQEFDSRQGTVVNDGIGSRMIIVNPLAYDWEGQLEYIADELAKP
ncbi:MAG: zinc ABC transporter substrate-binding protein [Muribaculaceae bacterium]|nr:zinc ABC transporter substrate-binding protein [Muribaculaceae bacterium]